MEVQPRHPNSDDLPGVKQAAQADPAGVQEATLLWFDRDQNYDPRVATVAVLAQL